ncbi:hypothetical protein P691DRAFT_628680, partial [Macrolepiota fuliginosa MF-IS2]
TGHSYLGNYYHTHVPSERISCPCGENLQTCKHILCSCPTYKKHHQILRDTSDTLYLPDILGTKAGISALAEFLEKSGAFTKSG